MKIIRKIISYLLIVNLLFVSNLSVISAEELQDDNLIEYVNGVSGEKSETISEEDNNAEATEIEEESTIDQVKESDEEESDNLIEEDYQEEAVDELKKVIIAGEEVDLTQEILDDPEYYKYYDSEGNPLPQIYSDDDLEVASSRVPNAVFGCDVSKWQGKINWNTARNNGINFTFVRVGYRGNDEGKLYEDPRYDENLRGAIAENIRAGVYFFSRAINEQEAVQEAEFLLARIYKYNITMPVVIDYEAFGADQRSANLSKAQYTSIVSAFCDRIRNAGYTPMIYGSASYFETYMDGISLCQKYRLWMAAYSKEPYHYTNATYDFWQYTDSGNGTYYGMEPGGLDLDWWYNDGTIWGKDYSAVFDPQYYSDRYPDLKAAFGTDTTNLLTHFISCGMREGRSGSAEFNAIAYKNRYVDLRKAFGNDLTKYYEHYMNCGKREGRIGIGTESVICDYETVYNGKDYSKVFDANYYISKYPDVKRAYGYDDKGLLSHFVLCGMNEGRQGCSSFNVYAYRGNYNDLTRVFGSDLKSYYEHFITYGYKEGRNALEKKDKYNVVFKDDDVIVSSQTVQYGGSAIEPYISKNGVDYFWDNDFSCIRSNLEVNVQWRYIRNGTDYTDVFNAEYYLNKYADLRKAFGNDANAALTHFINCGMKEGRQAKSQFDVHAYRGNYLDLQKAFGGDLKSYYIHYLNCGKKEGRSAITNSSTYTVSFKNGAELLKTQTVTYGHSAAAPNLIKTGATLSWDKDFSCITSNLTVNVQWRYIRNGVDYTDVFDADYYLNKYADLRNAFGNDANAALTHFINCGMREGRQAKDSFNVHSYKNKYVDLRNAFGNDLKSYYLHYIYNGKSEGRTA